jgi:Rieske 2Fe-2S family protein
LTTIDAQSIRTPGHSLPGPLYTSDESYWTDIAAVFGRSWLFVATEPEIAEPGDYVTVALGRWSVVLIRDDDMRPPGRSTALFGRCAP